MKLESVVEWASEEYADAQEAYAQMWRELASHYRGRASIVGYDLMCEPHPDNEATQPLGDWNALAKKITAAIREIDKDTPLLRLFKGYFGKDTQFLEDE